MIGTLSCNNIGIANKANNRSKTNTTTTTTTTTTHNNNNNNNTITNHKTLHTSGITNNTI